MFYALIHSSLASDTRLGYVLLPFITFIIGIIIFIAVEHHIHKK